MPGGLSTLPVIHLCHMYIESRRCMHVSWPCHQSKLMHTQAIWIQSPAGICRQGNVPALLMLLWQPTVHRQAASGAAVQYALLARPMRLNTLTVKSKKLTKFLNQTSTCTWHGCGAFPVPTSLKHVLTFAGKFADCRRQSNKRIHMMVAATFAHFPTSRSDLTFVKFIPSNEC